MNQNDKTILKQELYLELFNKKNQGMSKKQHQEAMYNLIYPRLKNYAENNRDKYSNLTDEDYEDLILDVIVSVVENSYQRSEADNYHVCVAKAETKLKRLLEKTDLKKSQKGEELLYSSFVETINHKNPLDDCIKNENEREILNYMDRLPGKESIIIKQRYFDNLGYDDIAKNLKITRAGVQFFEKKAIGRLKKMINTEKKETLKRHFVYDMTNSYDKKIMLLRVLDRLTITKIAEDMALSPREVGKIIDKYSAAMNDYVQEHIKN